MRRMPFKEGGPMVRLLPRDIFFSPDPHRLYTLLGSCVAVCLWDHEARMGGMTHSTLPSTTSSMIRDLLEQMLRSGCKLENIYAKLFGGVSVLQGIADSKRVGKANVEAAQWTLNNLGIEIVASQLFGSSGLAVYYNTETGEVATRLVKGIE